MLRPVLSAALLSAMLILPACGGDDDGALSSTASTPPEATTTSESTTPPESSSDEPAPEASDDLPTAIANCLGSSGFERIRVGELQGTGTALVSGITPQGTAVDLIPLDTKSQAERTLDANARGYASQGLSADGLTAILSRQRPDRASLDDVNTCTSRRLLERPAVQTTLFAGCLERNGYDRIRTIDGNYPGVTAFGPDGREVYAFRFESATDAEQAAEQLESRYTEADLMGGPDDRSLVGGAGAGSALGSEAFSACLTG